MTLLHATTADEALELGRRAVATPHWRWMPGMVATFIDTDPDPPTVTSKRVWIVERHPIDRIWLVHAARPVVASAHIPDLCDPTTCGCLLGLVREAWGEPSLSLCAVDESVPLSWVWTDGGLAAPSIVDGVAYRTETEALVVALERAP